MKKFPEIIKVFSEENKAPKSLSLKEEQNNTIQPAYFGELEELGELCIPIYVEKQLSHLLVLPEKNSQSSYTKSEKNAMYSLRSKISLSLQILQYNKTLQDEVARQTKKINQQALELKKSYEKLEALDKEKDVFINMAAHELRTPMTIIH
jgi:signal transduction histidine kinase